MMSPFVSPASGKTTRSRLLSEMLRPPTRTAGFATGQIFGGSVFTSSGSGRTAGRLSA